MNWEDFFSHVQEFTDMESTDIELYNSFLREIVQVLPLDRALIYDLDHEKKWLICKAVAPRPDLPFWQCFSLDEDKCIEVSSFKASEIIISNENGLTDLDRKVQELTKRINVLCIPLNIKKENQGLICLEWRNGALPPNSINLIKLHLLILGICIERNRYKQKFEDISERLFSFHHGITAINYTTQYEETIKIHLSTMLGILKGRKASLMLVRNGHLRFELAQENGIITKEDRLSEEPIFENWVLKENIPFFVNTEGPSKNVIIPLVSRKNSIGTITIKTNAENLVEHDNKLISFCASHLASVIENYNLFRDIQIEKNNIGSILNSSPVGVIITDIEGKILAMNQSATDCLNLQWKGFFVEHDNLFCPDFIMKILSNKSDVVWPVEVDLSKESHLDFGYLSVTAAEVYNDNNVIGFTIALQNITEKKALETEIERVNKMASLGTIAAGVAHEIRNPLMSLSLFLDEIHDNFSKGEKKNLLNAAERKLLVNALHQIDRLDKIVSTLLNFSSKEKKEIKLVDTNKSVKEIIDFIKRKCEKNNIKLETDYRKLPKIMMDEQKLKQALLNICLNAIQAMPNGGTLKTITSVLDKNKIRITISDTGSGISKENIDKIFSPFFSTKEKGIGLGLSITEKIVTDLGGNISLISNEGKGTEFSLIFPK